MSRVMGRWNKDEARHTQIRKGVDDHPHGFLGERRSGSLSGDQDQLSHPLRIDELSAGNAGGLIGITICPGKCGDGERGRRWERDLVADLDVIEAWRPAAVVTLIEKHEFEMLGVAQLGEQIRARGIGWHHLPIVDLRRPMQRLRPPG